MSLAVAGTGYIRAATIREDIAVRDVASSFIGSSDVAWHDSKLVVLSHFVLAGLLKTEMPQACWCLCKKLEFLENAGPPADLRFSTNVADFGHL